MNPERVGLKDADYMLALLEASAKPLTTMEIINASMAERGCGLTPRARAFDLRQRGHKVECKVVGRVNGRNLFEYRLASSPQSAVVEAAHVDVGRGEDASQLALPLPGSALKKERAA